MPQASKWAKKGNLETPAVDGRNRQEKWVGESQDLAAEGGVVFSPYFTYKEVER